jgi:protein phosphatase
MVHEDLILAVVASTTDPENMCRRLIDAANDAGGHDNITVVAEMFKG